MTLAGPSSGLYHFAQLAAPGPRLLSEDALAWAATVAGGATALACAGIVVVLGSVWRRRRAEMPMAGLFFALTALILAVGISQAWEAAAGPATVHGWVAAREIVKAVLAVGVLLLAFKNLRLLLTLPSPAKTEQLNRELTAANGALHASEEIFRTFMDNGPLRCWLVDANGGFRYANRAYRAAHGLPADPVGFNLADVFPVELAETFKESDRAIVRHGHAPAFPEVLRIGGVEYEIYKFPVQGTGGETLIGGIALDVTEPRANERALRQNSEVQSLIAEAMRTYLENGDWKTSHGLLLRCALRLTESEYGFVGVLVEGPKLRILAHDGIRWDDYLGREFYDEAMRTYQQLGYIEFTSFDNLFGRVVTTGERVLANFASTDPRAKGLPPGHPPLNSFLGVPVRQGKKVVGVIAVANRAAGYDERSQAQLENLVQPAGVLCDSYLRSLREASLEEQVRVSQKMEAVGLLAGGVAHDFNNLLQVIKGYTSVALEPATAWPERRSSLEQVRLAADRAAQLTQQLLAFGRQQTLQKSDVDLNHAIKDLLRMIRRVIGEQITVDFIPGYDLGNVLADRAQLDQVLLNLCLNARDALPQGGRITIETENVLVNGTFRESHPWAKPGRYVLTTVTDNGVGMSKETVARIFEPFFTTKPKDKGTGLGLAVVYGVVKQHDGMVHVYSEPGKGTTFKIYLPIGERSASSVGPKHTPSPGRGTETILLAEDEPMVRELAQRILTRAGYRVLVANDGAEACATFALHADDIALVILDVVMPQLGGREAYERLARLRPNLPVIFCSGYAGSALAADELQMTGGRLLAKPYGADEMLATVRAVLDGV